MKNPSPPNICPVCGQANDIRKISTIVASGTSIHERLHYQGSQSQSLLVHYLAPPPPPVFKPVRTHSRWLALAFLVLLCIWLAIGIIALCVLIGGANTTANLISLIDAFPVKMIFQILLCAEGFVILELVWEAYRGPAIKAKLEKKQREERGLHNRWKQALARWNQMYYCYRDDIVFLPGNPRAHTLPAHMNTLL